MIINILGHGLQWGNQIQEHLVTVEAPFFQSVNFYSNPGVGFCGTDTYTIIREEWNGVHHVVEDANNIPEHFILPDPGTWSDIRRKEHGDFVNPLQDDPRYAEPTVLHINQQHGFLMLRQIIRPQNPFNETQLAIQSVNACISLSWLIHNIPEIIAAHDDLAALPNNTRYTYRWLICRDFIDGELNPHNNANSLAIINQEIEPLHIYVDELIWPPETLL